MSNISSVQITDNKLEGLASETPFAPRVFTVTGGTYASTSNFGAGAAVTGNLDSITLRSGTNNPLARTGASVHRSTFPHADNSVEFTVEVSIDQTVAVVPTPPAASAEVRIGVLPRSSSNYGFGTGRAFPPVSTSAYQPLFEAEQKTFPNPTGAPTVVLRKARLLVDGNLALLQTNGTTPVLVSDITATGGATGAAAVISIRGQYRAQ